MAKPHYLTGIEALNYHGYDWHSFCCDFNREYPEEVRTWAGDYGVVNEKNREIANPIRAFLDYLFFNFRFNERVPERRFEDLLFSEEEEKELANQIEKLLVPVLTKREKWLFGKWKQFNEGGDYEFVNFKLFRDKAWQERIKKTGFDFNSFRKAIRKAFNF